MVIRAATDQDIPAIVNLLKVSLGEGLMPKSVDYWAWKHIDNPFGRSPVLVAEEGKLLVGVRAFMRWEWTDGINHYRAVRAVDTATHPEYQGRGIFKKLTLALVDQCRLEGTHFIFNTPNTQSRPGYLKMGWVDAGRLPVRIVPVIPLKIWGNRGPGSIPFVEWQEGNTLLTSKTSAAHPLKTITNRAYYNWRYATVPVARYFVVQAPGSSEAVIYRLKKGRIFTEMRIVEILTNEKRPSSKLWVLVKEAAISGGAQVITFSGSALGWTKGWKILKGPVVTVNDLNLPEFDDLKGFKKWAPTLGDLELF